MPERIIQRARNFSPNLYINVPFKTKAEYGIERGDTVKIILTRIADSRGKLLMEVGREIECPVKKRDGRVYLPPDLVRELNVIGVEYYEIILQKVVKTDGREVEIYPGETVEREAPIRIR